MVADTEETIENYEDDCAYYTANTSAYSFDECDAQDNSNDTAWSETETAMDYECTYKEELDTFLA